MYYYQGGLFNRNHKNLEAGQSALHTCHLECIGIHLSTFLLLFPPCNSTDKVYQAAILEVKYKKRTEEFDKTYSSTG